MSLYGDKVISIGTPPSERKIRAIHKKQLKIVQRYTHHTAVPITLTLSLEADSARLDFFDPLQVPRVKVWGDAEAAISFHLHNDTAAITVWQWTWQLTGSPSEMAPNCQSMVMEVGCLQVETVRMGLIVCQETDCNVVVIFAMDVVMFLKCNSITRLQRSKIHPASSEHDSRWCCSQNCKIYC